jgi:hypothetical protein
MYVIVAGMGFVITFIAVVHLTVTVQTYASLNLAPLEHKFSVATIFKLYTPLEIGIVCVITNFIVVVLIEKAGGTVPPAYICRE